MQWLHTSSGTVLLASSRTPTNRLAAHTHTHERKNMIYKLIEIVIEELTSYCIDEKNSVEFRSEVAKAVEALRNIKKYF